jgi:hypothetical protein
VSEPLPLADAQRRLGKPGRPRLSDEEKARRAQHRAAARAVHLAAITPRLLDVEGAARYMSFSTWTIRDLIAAGKLPRVIIPSALGDLRAIRIAREDLDRLIETSKERTR